MIFKDFEVLEDDGKTLIETLPAILYIDRQNIIAQVPSGTTTVTFTALSTGQAYTETVTNGKATFTPSSNDTYRVGNETITKHNEITVSGIKTLNDVKADKLAELEQAYQASFTTFQSSALGSIHNYPYDAAAKANLNYYVSMAAANPNKSVFSFKTIENGIVDHTRTQFLQLVDDANIFEVNLDKKFETKDKQRTSCTTMDQVHSITWNDTTVPAAPTGLAAAPGTAQATLSWTANSEIDVQIGGGYNIYKAGTKINTSLVTATTYTATGLTSGTAVSFTITAVDSDGNESPQSTAVITTPN